MKFYTDFFKSVNKDAIVGHPDLRLEEIELGEFLFDKYDNMCLPFFDSVGNLDSIQHQDNYNWYTLHTLVVDLQAKLMLSSSLDELIDDENKYDTIIERDTHFVLDHCEDIDWKEYHNQITEFNGISSKELERITFDDKGEPNWQKYFKSDVRKRLYAFDDSDYNVVCYKTLKYKSMENLMYTYLIDEKNKFSLISNEDEGCYIDDEDELGCGKLYNGLYLLNNSANLTIQFEYEFNRKVNQFRILYFKVWDWDDNYTRIDHSYNSFFDLVNDGVLSSIIKLWLNPKMFMDQVLEEFNNNEQVVIGVDDLPF